MEELCGGSKFREVHGINKRDPAPSQLCYWKRLWITSLVMRAIDNVHKTHQEPKITLTAARESHLFWQRVEGESWYVAELCRAGCTASFHLVPLMRYIYLNAGFNEEDPIDETSA
jgi:hypothetical protein